MKLSQFSAGGVPIGGLSVFPNNMPIDFTNQGVRFLRTGFIETNTANFDNTLFSQSRATFWQDLTASAVAGQPPQTMASNGSGTFVAIYNSGSLAGGFRRSTDGGVTWGAYTVITPTAAGQSLLDIIWVSSLSLSVIVGANGLIFTSPDGNTWTQRTSGTTQALNAVAWNGSLLVAVGGSGTILTSTNGTTWTSRTSNVSVTLTSVAFGGGVWFVTGNGGALGSTRSSDGTTWTATTTTGSGTTLGQVIHDGTQFVLIGTSSDAGVWTSTNGATWTKNASTVSLAFASTPTIGFANGQYVASGGSSSGTVLISTDLTNWKTVKVGQGSAAGSVGRIRFVFDRWVLACPTPNTFYLGNGYIYAGWPYQLTESNGADLTGFGVNYVRIR